MNEKNFFILEIPLNQQYWHKILNSREKINKTNFSLVNKVNEQFFKKEAAHILSHNIMFDWSFKNNDEFYFLPTYFYQIKNVERKHPTILLWFFKINKIAKPIDFSIENIEFDWNFPKNSSNLLRKINTDIARFEPMTSYFFADAGLIGDFKLTHYCYDKNKQIEWLDYEGRMNLKSYPFFEQIDTSRFNKDTKIYEFNFIANNNEYSSLNTKEISLVLELKSQFIIQDNIVDYELIKDLDIPGVNSVFELIDFRYIITKHQKLIQKLRKKVIEFIDIFNKKNNIILPNDLQKSFILAHQIIAKNIKKNSINEHLKTLILDEYDEQKYFYFGNPHNAINQAKIDYFYIQYEKYMDPENHLFEQYVELFNIVRLTDICAPYVLTSECKLHDDNWKIIHIFSHFLKLNNSDLYKKWILERKIIEI